MTLVKQKYLALVLILISGVLTLGTVLATDREDNLSTTEVSAILDELKNIRDTLERIEKKSVTTARAAAGPKKPKIAQISSINRPVLGSNDAPVTIVEVSDYQCPFCKRFADSTMKALKRDFIDTGKVRVVFKDLPLSFHKESKKVAQVAHCAGDQGKYWSMHDKLFANMKKHDQASFINRATELDLDIDQFKKCITSDKHLASIEKDISDANKAGLSGTPSFVIGKTTDDIIKGDVVIGAHPISSLKQYIEKYL